MHIFLCLSRNLDTVTYSTLSVNATCLQSMVQTFFFFVLRSNFSIVCLLKSLFHFPRNQQKIKEFMNASHAYRFNTPMDGDTQLNLYSLLVAIFAVGGMLGGLMAGWWADFFGRLVFTKLWPKHLRI